MNLIHPDSIADIEFELKWESRYARHIEKYFSQINFWRDILPEKLKDALVGRCPGDIAELVFPAGEAVPLYDPKKELILKPRQFDTSRILPKAGRFYPKGVLKDVPNVFPNNTQPFRCVEIGSERLVADFNHPLSGYDLYLKATVAEIREKPYERGGSALMVMENITAGPGMQIRTRRGPTDFLSSPDSFSREDLNPDPEFYTTPRFVVHTDTHAIKQISELYGQLLDPGMDVLDLMSAWRSHLPESVKPGSVTGLGLNAEEMEDNPGLSDYMVHDINQNPTLPFEDRSFDLVICTVSVEYMTRPLKVFADTARILRPGGRFILTFSNRWFPPKVIRLWTELHEFERMGLLLEYFLDSGAYKDIETFSARGWPRPSDDKYYPDMVVADPVYGVWGRRA